ncbi:MAG: mannose-6-phosphate isomerase, partial [Hyphomicrobiaceae bacterium]
MSDSGADSPTAMLPRRIDKPWGYEIIWAHTDRYVGKILHIDAGHRLSYQFHREKEETIYVLH